MIRVFEATSPEQKEALYRFRYEVFTSELGKYSNTADHQSGQLRDEFDEVATHLCVASGDDVIGSMRQVCGRQYASAAMIQNYRLECFSEFRDENLSFTGRLVMASEQRGSRALVPLLQSIYENGRAAGVLFDFIFCDSYLVSLYEKLGYRRYCSCYVDPVLGMQVPLVLVADDVEYLERLQSPFAPVAKRWPSDRAHKEWLHTMFPEIQNVLSPMTLGREVFVGRLEEKIRSVEPKVLAGLNVAELAEFLAACIHIHIEAGTQVIRYSKMRELYLIVEGSADIRRAHPAHPGGALAQLGPGDFFGAEAVLTGEAREINVVAITPLEMIFIDSSVLQRFVKDQPSLAAKILLNLGCSLAHRMDKAA